jgi:hypothetical protein
MRTILKGRKSKYERLGKKRIQIFYHYVSTELIWKIMKDNTVSSTVRFSKWYWQFSDSFQISLLTYNQYFDPWHVLHYGEFRFSQWHIPKFSCTNYKINQDKL